MANSLLNIIQKSFETVPRSKDRVSKITKLDGSLTPNLRAIRLIATIAENMVAMGVPASDVTHLCLKVGDTYCTKPVCIDISYNLIMISQDRGVDREPLTIIRTAKPRGPNYQTLHQLFELIDDIRKRDLPLDAAEKKLDEILSKKRTYPRWVTYLSAGMLSFGIAILYTASIPILILTFIMGVTTSILMYILVKRGFQAIYYQTACAAFATIMGACIAWLSNIGAVDFLGPINPTIIVISGIVLLLSGMLIVAAFQDAIDEYYITAGARMLQVGMMTSGVVMGVAIGLYVATKLGIVFEATPERLRITHLNYQYIGAAIMSISFALGNQARWNGILLAGLTGLMSLYTLLFFREVGFGPFAAAGIAATIVGIIATAVSHFWKIPTLAIIGSGILPLVPGIRLYNGLLYIIQSPPGTLEFEQGVGFLLQALVIAIAIAAGASFGNLIGRPARRRLIHIKNTLPKHNLSH